MKLPDKVRECMVLVSVIGPYRALTSVSVASIAAFLMAITSKNLSPLWAARRLLSSAPDGVVVRVDWMFLPGGRVVGARMLKEGGEVRLAGGGLDYDPPEDNVPGASEGEIAGAVAGSGLAMVEYGPKHVLRWIAEASEGPETVGETEPARPVPGGAGNGESHDGELEFGGRFKTKVNPWR